MRVRNTVEGLEGGREVGREGREDTHIHTRGPQGQSRGGRQSKGGARRAPQMKGGREGGRKGRREGGTYLKDSPGEGVRVEEVREELGHVAEFVGLESVDGGVLLVEGLFERVLEGEGGREGGRGGGVKNQKKYFR